MGGHLVASRDYMSKIIDAEVMTGCASFMQQIGAAQMGIQSLYEPVKKFIIYCVEC